MLTILDLSLREGKEETSASIPHRRMTFYVTRSLLTDLALPPNLGNGLFSLQGGDWWLHS